MLDKEENKKNVSNTNQYLFHLGVGLKKKTFFFVVLFPNYLVLCQLI